VEFGLDVMLGVLVLARHHHQGRDVVSIGVVIADDDWLGAQMDALTLWAVAHQFHLDNDVHSLFVGPLDFDLHLSGAG
jgi:hypothetical protein